MKLRVEISSGEEEILIRCKSVDDKILRLQNTVSLLYGELDYGKTICLAVECGFDTDCNGATAGSILGMMLGENGIDSSWTAPIHNKLRTTIFGVGTITIDELVKRTKVHVVS